MGFITFALMQCWEHNKKCLEIPPRGYYGFVYVIEDDKGKKYWGKKAFSHKKRTKLSKKARKSTRKRIKVEQKDSGWQDYWGSSKPLLEYIKVSGKEGFSRKVLKLCKTRASLSYWEAHYLFSEKVLFRDCWNGHILSRFFKGKIHE